MIFGSSHFRTWVLVGIAVLSQAATAQRGSTGNTARRPGPPLLRAPPPRRTPRSSRCLSPARSCWKRGRFPEPVAIERICNGVTRREGYTDFKGQFEFQLGLNIGFQDASENDSRITPNSQQRPGSNSSRRPMDLTGCEFRAVLAGYQSSVAMLRTSGRHLAIRYRHNFSQAHG